MEKDHYSPRRERLAQQVHSEGLDAVLVTNPLNVTYLTGFSGEASYLIVSPRKVVLVSDGRFSDQLKDECPGLEAVIRPPSQNIFEATTAVLEKLGLKNVGCEGGHLTLADFEALGEKSKTIAWKPAADRVEQLRQIKDAWEIAQIREAIHMAEKAFQMFRAMIRPEDSEKELVDDLEMYIRRAGGRCSAFPPIVAVGERAALPHAPPTDRVVGSALLVLVDWGTSGAFYKSDLTRVLVPHNNLALSKNGVPGKVREVYETVERAQARAISVLRPGIKTGDVDAAAREVIVAAGYGEQFTHSTGHGFGLQIHEGPFLRPGTEVVLEAGMVVTIEPGIYLPGWGGVRLEDDALITPDGAQVLTTLPRDFSSAGIEF